MKVSGTLSFALWIASGCMAVAERKSKEQVPTPAVGDSLNSEGEPRSRAIAPSTTFLRCVDEGRWECVLQTAIVTYENGQGLSITLVAAVHSADAEHFRVVQEKLNSYPLVLYEGWRKEEEPRNERPSSESALIDSAMKASGYAESLVTAFLGFRQVDQWSGVIDYSRESFLNADMSFSEFAALSQHCLMTGQKHWHRQRRCFGRLCTMAQSTCRIWSDGCSGEDSTGLTWSGWTAGSFAASIDKCTNPLRAGECGPPGAPNPPTLS